MIGKFGEQLYGTGRIRGRDAAPRGGRMRANVTALGRATSRRLEVVQYDISGEEHIADVQLPSGPLVELQYSPMPLGEMRSREALYGAR